MSVPATPVKRNTTAKHSSPLVANPDDQKQLAVVIDYYHETLKQSPDALEYLNSRGLGDAELIDCFKLGYANRTLGYRLPVRNRKAGAEVRGQLQRVGIWRCQPWRAKRRLVVPSSREAALLTRRAHSARGEAK